jgi:hypothetical protein
VAALVVAPALAAWAQDFTVNQGNIIQAVLVQTISTRTNKVGDKAQAHCRGGDCGGFPAGTKFFAVLTEVKPRTDKDAGSLKAKFVTAVLPDGTQVPIEAQPQVGEEAKGSTEVKKGNKNKTTAVGAVGGALVADNEVAGAVVGGLIGRGLGKGNKTVTSDIEIKEGTPIQIRMLKTVTVKRPSKKG